MNKVFLVILSLFFSFKPVHSETIREWWARCNEHEPKMTCLSESELSKFKTLCSNKNYKRDCQKVVDFVVARTRLFEAKSFLMTGHASQMSNFSLNKIYLTDAEKIWNNGSLDHAFSFAVGVLPSCDLTANNKLIFSKNLRSDVMEYQEDILSIYRSLIAEPCPDPKNGFVLVAVGKVTESKNEFEIFTIDEMKNIKILRSALKAGPFESR